MQYYLELVAEYTIKKPEKEEKKKESGKMKLRGNDIDSDEGYNDNGGASKKKQNVERVAVNLAETQEANL